MTGGRPAYRRVPPTDPRRVAYDLLRAVAERDAYANLTLPGLLRERGLAERERGLATELGYGTLRAQGSLDAVLAACRELARVVRPGGVAIVSAPFLLGIHGYPHDYFRFTPAALAQPNLDPHRLLDARLAEPRARRGDGARGRAKAKRAGRSAKA